MPNVTGILETALYVEDLPCAVRFYQTVFHFDILFSDDRAGAMSVAGRQVLLLFKKGASVNPVKKVLLLCLGSLSILSVTT